MSEVLSFKRSDLDGPTAEATFGRIVRTGAPATHAVADAATDFLKDKIREIQDKQPSMDLVELFRRVATRYPNAWQIVAAVGLGEGAGYATNVEALEDFYTMEDA